MKATIGACCVKNKAAIPCEPDPCVDSNGLPIDQWDVSEVSDFDGIFDQYRSFNQDINGWDTSSVTTLNTGAWPKPSLP